MNTQARELQVSKETAAAVLRLAKHHQDEGQMVSSAQLCCWEAEYYFALRQYTIAYGRALKSLKYSVGILSPVYHVALGLLRADLASR